MINHLLASTKKQPTALITATSHKDGQTLLPALKRQISPFEFWPIAVFYTPVAFLWLINGVRFANFSLPLLANPKIHLSGIVGESKYSIFSDAGPFASQFIAPWIAFKNSKTIPPLKRIEIILKQLSDLQITYPFVAKPDQGCRGAGVQKIDSCNKLVSYLASFPENEIILFQKFVPFKPEASVFFVKYPNNQLGEITSLTLKFASEIKGNGYDSIETLIKKHPRAGPLFHLYKNRHYKRLKEILPEGVTMPISFAGSHSKGTQFRNGCHLISHNLTLIINKIANDLPEFYYGRFDLRFQDINTFLDGKKFTIIEINGASSEAAHIWDADTSLFTIYKTLLWQYNTLFSIGYHNYKRGFRSTGLFNLWKSWRREKRLTNHYPEGD